MSTPEREALRRLLGAVNVLSRRYNLHEIPDENIDAWADLGRAQAEARAALARAEAPERREPSEKATLVPVQYLAGLIEGAVWAERPGETSYCPRSELVEAWATEIAPQIESYVRAVLRGAPPSQPSEARCPSRAPDGVVAGLPCVLERGHHGPHLHASLPDDGSVHEPRPEGTA